MNLFTDRISSRLTSIVFGFLLFCGLVLLNGFVVAQMNTGPTIHACVNSTNGNTRIVDGADDCRRNETQLYWNVAGQTGPQGEPGPQGPIGLTGPMGHVGPAGQDGVAGYDISATSRTVFGADYQVFVVGCLGGRKATGGGFYIPGALKDNLEVLGSHPDAEGAGWRVEMAWEGCTGSGCIFNLYAICAYVNE